MQIGSGHSPLATAVMKALGVQAPAAPATPGPTTVATKVAVKTAGESAGVAGGIRAGAELPGDLGVAKNIPRGSFVDIKA